MYIIVHDRISRASHQSLCHTDTMDLHFSPVHSNSVQTRNLDYIILSPLNICETRVLQELFSALYDARQFRNTPVTAVGFRKTRQYGETVGPRRQALLRATSCSLPRPRCRHDAICMPPCLAG
jgi:hypothetical protein